MTCLVAKTAPTSIIQLVKFSFVDLDPNNRNAISAYRWRNLLDVFENLRTPHERSVSFAIAVIILGAKMAKADGQVTRDEVAAFREVFIIPKGEEKKKVACLILCAQTSPDLETMLVKSK